MIKQLQYELTKCVKYSMSSRKIATMYLKRETNSSAEYTVHKILLTKSHVPQLLAPLENRIITEQFFNPYSPS